MATKNSTAILVVDDEPSVCRFIFEYLRAVGYACETCSDSEAALSLLEQRRFDVIITDIIMPRVSGLDLLVRARRHMPDCKVILLTGNSCRETLSQALVLGAFDYLEKPFRPEDLIDCVQRASQDSDAPLLLPLKAAAALELSAKSVQASLDSVRALVRAVEAKDPYTRRHSEHVAKYAMGIAHGLGLSGPQIESVRVASLLHDVGKIGVPDSILTKPGPLTREERKMIRCHVTIGADILADITLFGQEAEVVRRHHERWDGTGYPDGLAGEDIPLYSRIIIVADSIDAMLMMRSYKQAYPLAKVLSELEGCSGTQFDPDIVTIAEKWCSDNPDLLESSAARTGAPSLA